MADHGPVTIGVFNTNDDVVELLRVLFEQNGFAVVSAHIDDVKRGSADLGRLVEQHRLSAIVYDLPPPYDRHWTFLQHMRSMDVVKSIPFVLTSTNPKRVHEAAGQEVEVLEIVGKPYDLDQILNAVKRAVRRQS